MQIRTRKIFWLIPLEDKSYHTHHSFSSWSSSRSPEKRHRAMIIRISPWCQSLHWSGFRFWPDFRSPGIECGGESSSLLQKLQHSKIENQNKWRNKKSKHDGRKILMGHNVNGFRPFCWKNPIWKALLLYKWKISWNLGSNIIVKCILKFQHSLSFWQLHCDWRAQHYTEGIEGCSWQEF